MSALSACGYFSQTTTELNYNPSDGVSASVGDVGARNLLVVGTQGSEGLVSGALVNNGTSDATVTISTPDSPQPVQISVPPNQIVLLGSGSDQRSVVVGNLKQPAGALTKITLSSPQGGEVSVDVPVVAPQGEYATVTPPAN
ncbi:MAG TPA: hypothetical protein VHO27_14875 [Angustibacter sp.]|nr:hypothetical protein [Angustibacter sp.]